MHAGQRARHRSPRKAQGGRRSDKSCLRPCGTRPSGLGGRLTNIGVMDSEPNIRNKISRGKFMAVFPVSMSGSNWIKHPMARLVGGLIVAITYCALWIGYGLLESTNYERQARAKTEEYSRHTSDKVAETCVGIPRAERIRCFYEAIDAQAEYEYNQADLVAQRQSALWAYIMAVAAIIGMALSAVGVWLVWTTFRETKRTADEANEANKISRDQIRAHLICEGGEFQVGENFANFTLKFKNIGNSNARQIRTRVKLWVARNGLEGGVQEFFGNEKAWITLIPASQTERATVFFSSIKTRFGGGIEQELIPQKIINALRDKSFSWYAVEVTFSWDDIFGRRQNISMSLNAERESISSNGQKGLIGRLQPSSARNYTPELKA
ncbi:DUF6471 domain-containing protein [Tsuneonella sp. CC-YZS046]|uniref:DUF6471 domain-containing protein n=1 Tax=Tsuneonella sp. CC-YZS046 TaxID=3042152 RepID=UPI002D778679|nr:DUF6471 domain-containing protein [Tsuneonella sp. CC-YZS046]WRO68258.1 DUF6471 domain-containing protein [Tsuneonella sp. CC-YZS046]